MKELLRAAVSEPLPLPGGGRTTERLRTLFEIGRADLEVARLAEAHLDAVAIAADVGFALQPGALYGVWAASGPDPLTVDEEGMVVRGTVPWCTGIGIVDRALVTAGPGGLLIDLPVDARNEFAESTRWSSPAFSATRTGTMRFHLPYEPDRLVGPPGSYLGRPGFWHGAIGVAACWAGGARGLYDQHLARWTRRDEHSRAHLGGAFAAVDAMVAVLDRAGAAIDSDPTDAAAAQARARSVRHTIERLCTTVVDQLSVGAGPEPLAFDAAIIATTQQLQLYIRQHHGERDLAPLGEHLLEHRA